MRRAIDRCPIGDLAHEIVLRLLRAGEREQRLPEV